MPNPGQVSATSEDIMQVMRCEIGPLEMLLYGKRLVSDVHLFVLVWIIRSRKGVFKISYCHEGNTADEPWTEASRQISYQ